MRQVVLLTPTGARPEAWELCKFWMSRQTYKGKVRWVVVDDGKEPSSLEGISADWEVEVVRPRPFWQPGMNTQARNLQVGLELVENNEHLIIIEDDDYYGPSYLAMVDRWLNYHELVGESHARYFRVDSGDWKDCNNKDHASLCSTATKGNATEELRRIAKLAPKFIDVQLWREYEGNKFLYDTKTVCGIKGLPGRSGIGMGHKMSTETDFLKLKEWIGGDSRYYGKRK